MYGEEEAEMEWLQLQNKKKSQLCLNDWLAEERTDEYTKRGEMNRSQSADEARNSYKP